MIDQLGAARTLPFEQRVPPLKLTDQEIDRMIEHRKKGIENMEPKRKAAERTLALLKEAHRTRFSDDFWIEYLISLHKPDEED